MDDHKISDNFRGMECCKVISPHHSHPTNGLSDFIAVVLGILIATVGFAGERLKTDDLDVVIVSPLCAETQSWNQNSDFWLSFPDRGSAPCGCDPLAWGQIATYHGLVTKHPLSGWAPKVVTETVYYGTQDLSGAIERSTSGQAYDWANVKGKGDDAKRIVTDLGIVGRSFYTSTGTMGTVSNIRFAEYFDYANGGEGCRFGKPVCPSSPTGLQEDWPQMAEGLLRGSLHGGAPLVVMINTSGGGHAIICDGYGYKGEKAYFHLHYGWGEGTQFWVPIDFFTSMNNGDDAFVLFYANVHPNGLGCVLAGRVTRGGKGVSNERVVLSGGASAVTDENGAYWFTGLSENTEYTLSVGTESRSVKTGIFFCDDDEEKLDDNYLKDQGITYVNRTSGNVIADIELPEAEPVDIVADVEKGKTALSRCVQADSIPENSTLTIDFGATSGETFVFDNEAALRFSRITVKGEFGGSVVKSGAGSVYSSETVVDADLTIAYGVGNFGAVKIAAARSLTVKDAETVDSLVGSDGGLIVDATDNAVEFTPKTPLTLDEIRAYGGRIKVVGSGLKGASFDYPLGASIDSEFGPNLIFEGGLHRFSYRRDSMNDKVNNFASGDTDENPTIRVTGGAVLNFTSHDLSGWVGKSDAGGVIRVDSESQLNFINNAQSTSYYRQRLFLEPGGRISVAEGFGERFRLNGGPAAESTAQIAVPAVDPKAFVGEASISGAPITFAKDNEKGIGIAVGENSVLKIENVFQHIDGGSDAVVAKYGSGALKLAAKNTAKGSMNVYGGVLDLEGEWAGQVIVNSGAALAGTGSVKSELTFLGGSRLNVSKSGCVRVDADLTLKGKVFVDVEPGFKAGAKVIACKNADKIDLTMFDGAPAGWKFAVRDGAVVLEPDLISVAPGGETVVTAATAEEAADLVFVARPDGVTDTVVSAEDYDGYFVKRAEGGDGVWKVTAVLDPKTTAPVIDDAFLSDKSGVSIGISNRKNGLFYAVKVFPSLGADAYAVVPESEGRLSVPADMLPPGGTAFFTVVVDSGEISAAKLE